MNSNYQYCDRRYDSELCCNYNSALTGMSEQGAEKQRGVSGRGNII
jgi:hypothetical protein